MIGRTRMGAWGVEATAARLADIHGSLLHTVQCLGAWIAIAPELETKIGLAYHIHDLAQTADQVGRRIETLTAERPAVPRPHNRSLLRLLGEMYGLAAPDTQMAALYRVLLPALLQSCHEHLEQTSPVADEPTVRVLHQAAETLESIVIWGSRRPADPDEIRRFSLLLAECGGLHGPGAAYDGADRFLPRLVDLPARDDRFPALEPGKKMPKAKPLASPEGRVRLLHIALINLEIPAIEVCGRMIAEFPDAPWEMRLDLAAQMWDEARHAVLCADRLQELGGRLGQFPYHHRVWEHSIAGPTLAERFITTQRIHEGNGIDQTLLAREALAEVGDLASSQIMDYILADEVMHVRSGLTWTERIIPEPEERKAVLRLVEERLGTQATGGPPLNREGRRRAGFSEVELDWLTSLRQRRG